MTAFLELEDSEERGTQRQRLTVDEELNLVGRFQHWSLGEDYMTRDE